MSESITVGRIAFERTAPRVLRVVKRDPKRDEYIQRHELSMLELLIEKYQHQAVEIVRKKVLDKQ